MSHSLQWQVEQYKRENRVILYDLPALLNELMLLCVLESNEYQDTHDDVGKQHDFQHVTKSDGHRGWREHVAFSNVRDVERDDTEQQWPVQDVSTETNMGQRHLFRDIHCGRYGPHLQAMGDAALDPAVLVPIPRRAILGVYRTQ